MNREAIYSTLFALVSGLSCITSASRRWEHFEDVPAANFPALYQVQLGENTERKTGQPPKRMLRVDFWIYVNFSPDSGTVPMTVMNPILDAIEAALEPPVGFATQTLGGLVHHCFIAARTDIIEEARGGTAIAVIPVEILVAGF